LTTSAKMYLEIEETRPRSFFWVDFMKDVTADSSKKHIV